MSLLGHRAPNVEKLAAKSDVEGLIAALSYAQHGHDSDDARTAAANVVRGAVAALAQIGDPRAVAPLIETFADNAGGAFGFTSDRDISARSLEPVALAKFGPAAIDPLLSTLRQGIPRMRAIAAVALGLIGDARAVPALLEAGDYPQQAIWALGTIGGDDQVVEALIGQLGSDLSAVQRYATHGLGSGKCGPSANDALFACVGRGDRTAPLAIIALCELGDPRGLDEVLAKGVQEAFVLLPIGEFDDPRARDLLAGELERAYPDRRRSVASAQRYLYAALGLASRRDPAAVRPLLDVLANPESMRSVPWLSHPHTEAELAEQALRDLGPAAVEPLQALADDPDPEIQALAGVVLAALH